MLSILSANILIKSLLNCEGIFRLGGVWLFVNLATVLNKNLGLFWLLSMSLRICSVLAAFRACLLYYAILKTSKLVFLHLSSRFLERMGITVVPWCNTFFSNLFQFDGGNSF